MSDVLVRASDVEKTYGSGELAVPVLKRISLEVRAGALVLLMGPSGSGKTTLVSVLAGLLRPTAGHVELCGARISELSESKVAAVRRRHLGFVFQSYNLFPALSALDNVAEVLRMKGFAPREAEQRAADALDRVGLGDRRTHRPGELSGGQKQRVAIARALAGDPALIFGDEVTAALDTRTALKVMELLRAQVTPGRAILIVTHDRRLEQYADHVIGLEDGSVVESKRSAPDAAQAGAMT
ncbi:MAG: ABC transporter ATP-binding protein [Polyangiaceae bacterium]|nr:ABC transporter ATP-binding protein [Polyangiaceae bacterium]